jgi:molecular chaperone HscB
MAPLAPGDFARDHFALFGLPRRQALAGDELERSYRAIQAQVHPDKHTHLPDTGKRLAMQLASKANEAYLTLKDPLKRAQYLLGLLGHDLEIECNTAMPAEFLMVQMELREAVAEARAAGDIDKLERMYSQMRNETNAQYDALARSLDETGDCEHAAKIARQLMFQEKLLHEIDEALQAVEA